MPIRSNVVECDSFSFFFIFIFYSDYLFIYLFMYLFIFFFFLFLFGGRGDRSPRLPFVRLCHWSDTVCFTFAAHAIRWCPALFVNPSAV